MGVLMVPVMADMGIEGCGKINGKTQFFDRRIKIIYGLTLEHEVQRRNAIDER